MAQWDERDPRWLVREMGSSGSNVNGWHWEEKSKMSWARSRLKALLTELDAVLSPEKGTAKITGMKDLTGDAYLTRRKANKTLVVYDLTITLQWRGKLAEEESEVAGTVTVTEFSLDSDKEDYIITVNSDKEDEKYLCLVEAIKGLQPAIVDLLLQFDSEMKALQQ